VAGSRIFKASRPYKAHLQRGSGGVQAEVRDLRLDIDGAFMELETSGQLALYHVDVVPPTVTDDSSLGFSPFSKWIDSVAGREYTCISAGVGVAVWSETTNLGVVPGGIVTTVFGRVGIVTAASGDYLASQVTNDSGVAGAFVSDALDALAASIPPVAPVSSVFGRVGAVSAAASDYNASQVDNDSGVAGAFVSDALNALNSTKVPTTRVLTAGGGLAGGGDLGADRTFDVVALDASIFVSPGGIRVGVISNAQHGNRSGGSLHSDATPVSSGFMSTMDKAKLNGISPGAQVNAVNTVFGRTGAIVSVAGDYQASKVTNDSGVAGAFVSGALDALNSGKVGVSRAVTAGAGLTGGGDLSADRTFDVVANADGSIVANANDIQVGVLATDAQHGVRGGGTQHALADSSSAGFMSASDKIKLDAIGGGATSVWQEVVLDKDLSAPPGGPDPNDRYIVAAVATGAWAGQEDSIAEWNGATWIFLTPTEAFTAWVADEDLWYTYNGTWSVESSDTAHGVRGGGTLHAIAIASGAAGFMSGADKQAVTDLATTYTPQTRDLTAGTGLTGGGNLSADRTFNVAANVDGSIVVNADDVQVGILATDAQHGSRGGGTQHALATALVDGFMSAADFSKLAGLPSSAVPTSRTLTAGAGMTGGGDLSADRTFNVIANVDGSIVVNADDVQVGVLATDTQHGVRGGGTQHADAVAGGADGFMTGADKAILDDMGNAVQARRTTAFILTGPGFDDVTFDTTDVETDSAVLDHQLGTADDRILVGVAGLYMVWYGFSGSEDFNTVISGRVRINDTTVVPGSLCHVGGLSHNNDHAYELTCTFVVELAAADFLTLQVEEDDASGSTVDADVVMIVRKLR
jgi:hypothetical protein